MMTTKYIETPLTEHLLSKCEISALQESDKELQQMRIKGYSYFQKHGFPSIKNEEWRFTNMLPFLKDQYELQGIDTQPTLPEDLSLKIKEHLTQLQQQEHLDQSSYTLITINGRFQPEWSQLPDGLSLKVNTLAQAKKQASFQRLFGTIARLDGFSAVNTALFQDGYFLELADNTIIEAPIYQINIFITEHDLWLNPRQLIHLGKNSQLSLIESSLAFIGDHKVFINGVNEINLEDQAHLHHYDVQVGQENIRLVQRTEASQKTHANYSNYTFTFPGMDVVRNTLNLHLDTSDSECHLYGLYFSADKQTIDNHTEVHHKFPNCESNQLYKGVLLDQSKAIFNGKIYVYEDAQKTNAFQQSNNILLSQNATVDAKPQLEIFADDVKATHGTTVGQLDEEAIFYLQARGISKNKARAMMINAFAFDVTQKVQNKALRSYLDNLITNNMAKAKMDF